MIAFVIGIAVGGMLGVIITSLSIVASKNDIDNKENGE